MSTRPVIVDLDRAGDGDGAVMGGKAATLGALAEAGFPVPPGFVVTAAALELRPDQLNEAVAEAATRLGPGPYAVRSSAAAEDLREASYAGLYETFLNTSANQLPDAVRRCFASARAERVAAYQRGNAPSDTSEPGTPAEMAVLVQPMVAATAAGVAFTAHPVTGVRDQTVVTAVVGLGEPLVAGEAMGEEWTIHGERAERTNPASQPVIDAGQARAVAALARRVADRYRIPQDIEWALQGDQLVLLQARPMTAVPEPVDWTPPGPGLWMRNFRLGEWLPEAMTPLFADWLLPRIESGYLAGMRDDVGTVVPFRYAAVNGWYYNALPVPSPRLLARILRQGRSRAVWFLFNALVQVSRNPVAADRALLADLERKWRGGLLPEYRRLVDHGEQQVDTADPDRLIQLVDEIAEIAGRYFWSLAVVGGSAWKIEATLIQFVRHHLAGVLDAEPQVLLSGLPGAEPGTAAHAVHSLDWHERTSAEHGDPSGPPDVPDAGSALDAEDLRRRVVAARTAGEQACRRALVDRPAKSAQFTALLQVAQRYAVVREQQARDLTLGWPLLRRCAHQLGRRLATTGVITAPDDVFFLTHDELLDALAGRAHAVGTVPRRRAEWQARRRLTAPLTLGRPSRIIGDPIAKAVATARGDHAVPPGALVGQPASPGRATGRVRIIRGLADFAAFTTGEVLVAAATAPAWTPLFARAAAVVTDGGTLAAHASLVAREYAIPAVVGTGNATNTLRTGQLVTVDGTTGVVIEAPATPRL